MSASGAEGSSKRRNKDQSTTPRGDDDLRINPKETKKLTIDERKRLIDDCLTFTKLTHCMHEQINKQEIKENNLFLVSWRFRSIFYQD